MSRSACRCLVGLGALNVRSLNKLESLQSKVSDLQKNVQEVSDSAELSSKADQLDALYADDPTVESAAAAASRILGIPALGAEFTVLPQILPANQESGLQEGHSVSFQWKQHFYR